MGDFQSSAEVVVLVAEFLVALAERVEFRAKRCLTGLFDARQARGWGCLGCDVAGCFGEVGVRVDEGSGDTGPSRKGADVDTLAGGVSGADFSCARWWASV